MLDEFTQFPLEFSACRQNLIWANERVVDKCSLDVDVLASCHTVVWLIESGDVRVDMEDETIEAGSGSWLFLKAADGRQHFTKGTRITSLRFDLTLLSGQPIFSREKNIILPSDEHPELFKAAIELVKVCQKSKVDNLFHIERRSMTLAENYRIEAAFMAWLGVYVDTMVDCGERPCVASTSDPRVIDALAVIERHPMQKKLSEKDLAERCGMSINQLSRLFQKELGTTPVSHYKRRRLFLACHALQDTRMPVKEIAFELGFSSQPHFTNWFAKQTGKSPSVFREDSGSVV